MKMCRTIVLCCLALSLVSVAEAKQLKSVKLEVITDDTEFLIGSEGLKALPMNEDVASTVLQMRAMGRNFKCDVKSIIIQTSGPTMQSEGGNSALVYALDNCVRNK